MANMLKYDRKKRFDLVRAKEFYERNFLQKKDYGLREPRGEKILFELKKYDIENT